MDIIKKKVVKIITGIDTIKLVSVNNVQREQEAALVQNMINEASVQEAAVVGSSMSMNNAVVEKTSESDSSSGSIGIIAMVLAIVAVVLGAMNLVLIQKMNSLTSKAGIPGAPVGDDEVVTLGSKEAV